MATFPTDIPTLTNPAATDKTNNQSHSALHSSENDEIEAIATKVGKTSDTNNASHDYKLSEVTGTDKSVGKTATQTLTNKTLTSPTINSATLNSAVVGTELDLNGSPLYFSADREAFLTSSDTGVGTSSVTLETGGGTYTFDSAFFGISVGEWLQTDTIKETTVAAGVTVDSLLIKDGGPSGWDGWQLANESWTYASATTITVPSGAASKYAVGDKIKLTQTTVKYFYIVTVADTLLTVTGGSDYTLVNAAISLNYYSHGSSPIGFPQYFNFTPTYVNLTVGAGTNTGRFSMQGRQVYVTYHWVFGSGAAVSTGAGITAPVNIADIYASTGNPIIGHINVLDSGVANYVGTMYRGSATSASFVMQTASGTYLQDSQVTSSVPVSWGTSDSINGYFTYIAA
jgi:hypothetical protein